MKMKVNPRNPGGEKFLKPFNERPVEEVRAIQSKGGKTVTPKKMAAARLRGWKMKLKNNNLKAADMNWLKEQLMDDKSMATSMLDWVERYKERVVVEGELKDMYLLAQVQNMIFKSIHGERVKVQSVNVNVNVGDEWANAILNRAFSKKDE